MLRLLPILLLLFVLVSPAAAQQVSSEHPALESRVPSFEDLVGKEFVYDISFLWFHHLAKGRFTLMAGKEPGTYRAILEARALGLAAWLTQDRVQSYVSLMERGADGQLRSLSYQSRMLRRRDGEVIDRTKLYTFDYAKHEVRIEKLADGKPLWQEVQPMTGGAPPNDILTTFFNFRAGRFGPLEPGRHYLVPTFDRHGEGNIEIYLLRDSERKELDFFPAGGMVARLKVDPEIFDSKDGGIYVWLDDQLRPARGIVQNVIGLGDVRGTLRP